MNLITLEMLRCPLAPGLGVIVFSIPEETFCFALCFSIDYERLLRLTLKLSFPQRTSFFRVLPNVISEEWGWGTPWWTPRVVCGKARLSFIFLLPPSFLPPLSPSLLPSPPSKMVRRIERRDFLPSYIPRLFFIFIFI